MAAANNDPIYSKVGDVSANGTTTMPVGMVTATGDYTGVSANHVLVFTADATNGGFVQRLRFKATGTNTASVARIYLNNGSTAGTATNNTFYGEVPLPAITAINTTATLDIDYPMNFALNPGFRIYVGLGTTVAASWVCTAIGGKY
jgi:hypothetical protein